MMIADCNYMIGQVELRSYNYVQAFSAVLKCYRSRFFTLGEKHNSTVTALNMLEQCRTSGGSRFLGGIELKERVENLKWSSLPQIAQPHVIALFINRLDDEHILTYEQLDSLVSAALVYHENILANQRSNAGNYSSRSHSMTKQQAIALLMNASNPTFRERCTSSSTMVEESISPMPSPSSQRNVERPKQIVATGSMKLKSQDTRTTTPKSDAPKNRELVILSETPSAEDNGISSTSVEAKLSLEVDTEEEKLPTEQLVPASPSSSKSSNDLIATAKGTNQTPSDKAKRTWRPISLHSPLRIAATGGLSAFTNIDMQGKTFRLVRNDAGSIFFVRKCSIEFLRKAFRSKFIALGLLAWFAAGNSFATKKANPLLGGGAAAGAAAAPAGDGDKSDAKNALNALFGKRMGGPPPPGGPAAKAADVPKPAEPTLNSKFAPNPPRPPPLPTCWPPVPYTGEEAVPSKSEKGPPGSEDAKDAGEAPVDPNAPVKPKLKQVFLTSLNSIEGTFWAEPLESLIPVRFTMILQLIAERFYYFNVIQVEALFDDLEEEFAIAAKKKPAPFGSGLKNPTAEKMSKPAAKPAVEVIILWL